MLGERISAARINEIVTDADKRPDRLNAFEQQFIDSMKQKLVRFGQRATLTDKQADVLEEIEKKVYAT